MKHKLKATTLGGILLFFPTLGFSQNLTIGVASNFYSTIKTITDKLHAQHKDLTFTIIKASSTVLTAQITNGAKIDIFFSADKQKPAYIYTHNKQSFKYMEKPFPYAQGKLVYYTYEKNYDNSTIDTARIKKSILHDNFVMANPKKAPYGLASKEYIENTLHVKTSDIKNHTVLRSNIGLTFSTVYMGNVNSGFVAYSSIITKKIPKSNYKVLNTGYNPILQCAIVLRNTKLSHTLLEFMTKPHIIKIITDNGYIIP